MLNPNPWHIELRADTGIQEIITEIDIFAVTEQEAIEKLLAWKALYVKTFKPDIPPIGVCTSNWTEECVYQDRSRHDNNYDA